MDHLRINEMPRFQVEIYVLKTAKYYPVLQTNNYIDAAVHAKIEEFHGYTTRIIDTQLNKALVVN
jgi:hypothetical protein